MAGGWLSLEGSPRAAEQALTGSVELSEVAGVVRLSNGAGVFGIAGWPEVLSILGASGPGEIVDRVRNAEARRSVWADDATIAYCSDL